MNKRNRKGLLVSFAALALSAAAIFTYNQTLCRYSTSISGAFTFAPTAKRNLTATIENETVKLTGAGEAYVYLHVPADLEIQSITMDEQALVCTRTDVKADTDVHKTYGDGKIIRLADAQGQIKFKDGDVITVTFPEPPATPETSESSENETETITDTEAGDQAQSDAGTQTGTDTKADTSMINIHVIVVPIYEKGGSAQ